MRKNAGNDAVARSSAIRAAEPSTIVYCRSVPPSPSSRRRLTTR